MNYEVVCQVEDIPVGRVAAAEVDGVTIALARTGQREFHAVNDTCTHANVSLSEGELDGCQLECWLHGSSFDVRSGEPNTPPATVPVAVYPVMLEGDDVLVDVHGTLDQRVSAQSASKEN
ncbi:non-heme iron oxygenase ferredoxin subunit [Arsenicicoccus sp. UBA7492]|uniref:non-heme iron oxygenase ferredoxin subunit n=1 Tax=Arsenicicoccus sp. UBA7492 TaxID=1946057 RepID=UPI00257A3FAB|nr:non-heme iron oxygenase ferredoxin subunit [Arsenicicoccus sp. UBA7492]